MRVLHASQQIAHQQHWCDRCLSYIDPGDYYEREVRLYSSPRRVVVLKAHIDPQCDEWPPPDEDDHWNESWDKEETTDSEELPLAA